MFVFSASNYTSNNRVKNKMDGYDGGVKGFVNKLDSYKEYRGYSDREALVRFGGIGEALVDEYIKAVELCRKDIEIHTDSREEFRKDVFDSARRHGISRSEFWSLLK